MLRKDFARTTDSIGATNFYKMAMDFHNSQKQKELDANEIMSGYQKGVDMQNKNALVDALQGGDEEAINKAAAAYDPKGFYDAMQKIKASREASDLEHERQKELAAINNAAALERIKQTYANKNDGGFGNTQAGLALRIATNPEEYTPEMQSWSRDYLASKSSSAIYDKAYQGALGRKQGEREVAQAQQNQMMQDQNSSIDTLIGDIEANENLVGIYSPIRAKLGRITNGALGYNNEQLAERGNLIRQVGNIQNDIIAKARAAGQTGINTIAEIQQATKGLDENSSAAELIGALRAMQESNNALTKRMSQSSVDPKVQQALDAGYSMDEINAFLGR